MAPISMNEFCSHIARQLSACRYDCKACPETRAHPWSRILQTSVFDGCLQAYFQHLSTRCVCAMKRFQLVRSLGISWDPHGSTRNSLVRLRRRSSGWISTPGSLLQLADAESLISCTVQVARIKATLGNAQSDIVGLFNGELTYHQHISQVT